MKIKVYSLTTDNDDGLQTILFASEAARDKAQWDFVAEYYEGEMTLEELKEKHGEDGVYDAFEAQRKWAIDSMNHDDHEIEIPVEGMHPIAEITGVCQTVGSGEFRSVTIWNKDTNTLKMFVPSQ